MEGWRGTMVPVDLTALADWESDMRSCSSQWKDNAQRRAKRGFNKMYARVVRSMPFDQQLDFGDGRERLFDYSKVCSGVIVGRIPRGAHDLLRLRDTEGVSAVVSLNEKWELKQEGWTSSLVEDAALEWCHLPTPDFSSPKMEDIVTAVSFMLRQAGAPTEGDAEVPVPKKEGDAGADGGSDGESRRGKRSVVYVHCNRGRSRSCLVVACYLMACRDISGKQAIDMLKSVRRDVFLGPSFSSFWTNLSRFERSLAMAKSRPVRERWA